MAHSFKKRSVKDVDTKLEEFVNQLLGGIHIILEGTKASNEVVVLPHKIHYAAIAMKHFKGAKHFLDENSNFSEIASRYGLRRDLLGLYTALRVLERVINASEGNIGSYNQLLSSILLDFKDNYPGLCHINVEESLDRFKKLWKVFPESSELFFGIGQIFAWYSAELREHEILYPKTEELVSKLAGKKIEVVGAYHTDGIERYLKGEPVEAPKEWGRFVENLEPQQRDFIRLIEKKIF